MSHRSTSHRRRYAETGGQNPSVLACEQVTDMALLGILFVVPLVLGGRHELGRLVFVTFAVVAGVAWCVKQALLSSARWNPTKVVWLCATIIALVVVQLVPFSPDLLAKLAPRNIFILPFWNDQTTGLSALSHWNTLSLSPASTRAGLATLLAYTLLFFAVVGRLESYEDIRKLLKLVAVSVVVLAVLGLLQYFFTNGKFLWFWEVPFTDARFPVKGPFTCRNHFADFLVLGLGPVLASIYFCRSTHSLKGPRSHHRRSTPKIPFELPVWYIGLGLVILAVLMTLSRGGALALAVASFALTVVFLRHRLVSSAQLYGALCLVVMLICLISTETYDKLSQRLGGFVSGSLEELDAQDARRRVWAANVDAICDGGLFGAGVGSHREIYPMYLDEPVRTEGLSREYTHAENSYLQIAAENGLLGCALLVCGLGFVGTWCFQAFRRAQSKEEVALAAAVTAGLLASAAHAVVDFVWFVPACMSLVILLAACALRLSQLGEAPSNHAVEFKQSTWIGIAACAVLIAAWSVFAMWGPGTSALDWDRYQLIASHNNLNDFLQLKESDANLTYGESAESANAKAMIFHLRNVLAKEPDNARAHLRLAGLYLREFEQHQYQSQNAMSVAQIRSAAIAANFGTAAELREWLHTAFGPETKLLYQAYAHACLGLKLSPLEADGYLYLSDLCFLQGRAQETVEALVQQAVSLRPYDGRILFEVGRHYLVEGDEPGAIAAWKLAYASDGPSRLSIIRLLAGKIPAQIFLDHFQPDWHSLDLVWEPYAAAGAIEDMHILREYGRQAAERDAEQYTQYKLGHIWVNIAKMEEWLGELAASLQSLETAYEIAPDDYAVRRPLARVLLAAGKPSLAIQHYKWCMARHPEHQVLKKEYLTASRQVGLAEEELARYPTQLK